MIRLNYYLSDQSAQLIQLWGQKYFYIEHSILKSITEQEIRVILFVA